MQLSVIGLCVLLWMASVESGTISILKLYASTGQLICALDDGQKRKIVMAGERDFFLD